MRSQCPRSPLEERERFEHLSTAIIDGNADAVLCASIFHYGTFTVHEAKEQMAAAGMPVRR